MRFLLRQGLAFRGDKEFDGSRNSGNFLELMKFLAGHNDEIKSVTFKNALGNSQIMAPSVQKEITSAAALETLALIVKDIGDSLFSILVDESRDVSMKEQMTIVVRYVGKNGHVVEHFMGIEHVTSTTALSLKAVIDKFFSRHGLRISRLRGQCYDGASNMRCEFNGLKSLILKENYCAFYIHCFAHQLQLCLVAVAKKHIQVASLFFSVSSVVNIVGSSSKRVDILKEKQVDSIAEALENCEITSGKGLNQCMSLKRAGDTRWGSHYGTLVSLITMFSSTIQVLETIVDDGSTFEQRCATNNLLILIQSFEFLFTLHLMKLYWE